MDVAHNLTRTSPIGTPKWLEWSRKLKAIADTGLAYSKDPFEKERYEQISTIAVEMASEGTGLKKKEMQEVLIPEKNYITPKIDVRAGVFRDGKILLVCDTKDGCWAPPGGFADIEESPRECVEKEVWEESGYEAKATRLVGVYDMRKHPHPPHLYHCYKLFFLCEITGGQPKTSEETSGSDFFSLENLPKLSEGRITREQIERMFEFNRDPSLPADFD